MNKTPVWMTIALTTLIGLAAAPGAFALGESVAEVEGVDECKEEAKQKFCAQQGGNCNSFNSTASANVWINDDCSNTQTIYYCNTAAGSGAASAGVSTGASTDAEGSAGASAGGGCDQSSSSGGGNDTEPGEKDLLRHIRFLGEYETPVLYEIVLA